MFKLVPNEVWCFDAEWVPDPDTGRRVYGLPKEMPDEEVVHEMWLKAGATEQVPRPFIKTVLCRVASISALIRTVDANGVVSLRISSVPAPDMTNPTEATILKRFLDNLGKRKPQLVGFNSINADIVILLQRALANGIQAAGFCKRPEKPWEGADYFANGSDYNVDLMNIFSGWGKGGPSLHELATTCRIPGKLGTDGTAVYDMWVAGNIRGIVQYNECDALTTYLVWLRTAHLAGHISTDGFVQEQQQLRNLLVEWGADPANNHFREFLEEWDRLQS